jgi:hypothetical protein
MKFKMKTLVDITETNARFNKADPAWRQQQNYITVLQTIGLRANLNVISVSSQEEDLKGQGFGSSYKGNKKVWTLEFDIDYGSTSVEFLENDFNNVPVIAGLDETIDLKTSAFRTKDSKIRNIIFTEDDK